MASPELEYLITLFSKLPTLGPRSARRAVLHLINQKEKQFVPLVSAMQTVLEKVSVCPICGNMDTQSPCAICIDDSRNKKQVCVVRDVSDLWAIERSQVFKGQYHVLGGVLSALDGIGPEELAIQSLIDKVSVNENCEVISLNTKLEDLTNIKDIKIIGITDENLSKAIINNKEKISIG